MDNLGDNNLGNETVFTQQPLLEAEDSTKRMTTFKHESATVHIKFTKDGKRLDDLLINYFNNLKQQ